MTGEVIITAILSVILSLCCGWLWKVPIITGLDKVTALFGKSFSGRSEAIQNFIFGVIVFVLAALIFFLLKRIIRSDSKVSKTGIILCIALILILFSILCFEQVLRRDDYWEIHDSQTLGFPGFLVREFKSVNGRYFSLFLKSAYALFDPEEYIHFMLMAVIFLLYAACVYFSEIVLELWSCRDSVKQPLLCGLGLILAAVFMSPNLWEVWFWGAGALIYGVGIVLAITILGLYLDACRGNPHYALTFFCITCACGCSELVTVSVCAFGVGFILINWIIGNGKHNKPFLFFNLWSFLCVAYVFCFSASVGYASSLAESGNGEASNFLLSFFQHFPGLLTESVNQICRFLYSRLEYVLFLSLIFFLLGITVHLKKIRFLPLFLFVLLMILTAVSALMMNVFMGYVAPRVVTIPLIWVFLPIAMTFFLLGSHLHSKFEEGCSRMAALVCAVMMCVPVIGLYRNNIDLLRQIRAEWRQRDVLIQSMEDKSQPITVCTVPTIGSTPWDFSPDPDFEFNQVGAVYYDVPQIIGDKPCAEFFEER